jgi:ribosome-associated heat shock protein Hsp15
MYRRNDTADVYPAFRIIKIERTLSKKNGTGRPTKKDRRDIDEFGNDIISETDDLELKH